jgi:hypothetical protein
MDTNDMRGQGFVTVVAIEAAIGVFLMQIPQRIGWLSQCVSCSNVLVVEAVFL